MTDTIKLDGHPVPGMMIVFQQPLSPEQGHGISFQLAEDVMIAAPDLNELLDRVTGAARRLSYIEELPRLRQLLAMKRQALAEQKKERARAEANMQSNVIRLSQNRRNPASPTIQDQNAVAQFDARIAALQQEIGLAERRVPYLEAYIRGDRNAVEPVGDEPMMEAANGSALAAE